MTMPLRVINFFGAPGSGKSTLAAELFAALKRTGANVELIRDPAKEQAYCGKAITLPRQIEIFLQSINPIIELYDKVRTLVTDAPPMQILFYMSYYGGCSVEDWLRLEFGGSIEGIETTNILLPPAPIHKYNAVGRYETWGQAMGLHTALEKFLQTYAQEYFYVTNFDWEKDKILSYLLDNGVPL